MQKISLKGKRVLVTGAAGFIGANLVLRLLQDNEVSRVVGIDNLNDYYDPAIKDWRLSGIRAAAEQDESRWKFVRGDIADAQTVKELFAEEKPELVVNLAAQAGVRYSLTFSPTSSASTTFWRPADIRTTAARACSTSSMPRPPRFTEPTGRCRSPRRIRWMIRYLFMRRQKSPMS